MKYKTTAYPTILLFIFITSCWLYCLLLGIRGEISIGLSILCCSILGYFNFTVMHEVCHRNIFFKRSKLISVIEFFIAQISAATLFTPYETFKILHFQHHRFTNIEGKDPDFWVKSSNPVSIMFKCLSIKLSYYYFIFIKPTEELKAKRLQLPLIMLVYAGIIFLTPNPVTTFIIWFSSGVFSISLVAFLFDWLPHAPHDETDPYRSTLIVDKKWLVPFMLWQNYHLIHHLYPEIPFYKYHSKYLEIKDKLIEKNSRLS